MLLCCLTTTSCRFNCMGDNKLLICHHMSQVKSCDCETCKLLKLTFMKQIRFARAIEWYSRECERCFYFCEEALCIVCLESSRSTLESTCRDGEQRKVF